MLVAKLILAMTISGPPVVSHQFDLDIVVDTTQFRSKVVVSELNRDWPLKHELNLIKLHFNINVIEAYELETEPKVLPAYRIGREKLRPFPKGTFVASGSFIFSLHHITDIYYYPFRLEDFHIECDRLDKGFWKNYRQQSVDDDYDTAMGDKHAYYITGTPDFGFLIKQDGEIVEKYVIKYPHYPRRYQDIHFEPQSEALEGK